MKDRAVLQEIENDRMVDKTTDMEFLFAYQRAVLLALKEIGTFNEMQYRYAENTLKNQFHALAKKNLCDKKGEWREAP